MRAAGRRGRRGSQYIEFAILLPVFVAFLLFIMGVGQLVMLQAGLQDAAQQVARTGAQNGGLGTDCPTGGVCAATSVAASELSTSLSAMPGGSGGSYDPIQVLAGGNYDCSTSAPWVTVKVTYHAQLTIPLMSSLLQAMSSNWALSAEATARCEISRNP